MRLVLRRWLLSAEQVQERFGRLHALVPDGHFRSWAAEDGLEWWKEVGRAERDCDYAWSQSEIAEIVQKWPTYSLGLDEDRATVGVGFVCGRKSRGPRPSESTARRAARSIALHVGGDSWAEADQRVADEINRGRRARGGAGHATPSDISVYRKRLRDRS
jgi:hypothetical protein